MARQLRIEFPGALYDVTVRGDVCPDESGPTGQNRRYAAVSFAYSSASHLVPAALKRTCTRASAPWPSQFTITPVPNLG